MLVAVLRREFLLPAVVVMVLTCSQAGLCWKCDPQQTVCEVWLQVEKALTMMKYKSLIVINNGSLFNYDQTQFTSENAVPMEEVVTADGWAEPRVVIAINGTLPGPLIEVHEGQRVRVHVHNKLFSDITSLHFHGQHQKGTPWMDGVAYVSQCPTTPGQVFVHEFTAYPAGTYWYHSHVSMQREMGMYGGFIVHPKQNSSSSSMASPPARYHREFTLLIQDWNHDWDSTLGFFKMQYGMYVDGLKEAAGYRGLSGVRYSAFRIQSALINGRGRYRPNATAADNGAPLSTFVVKQGNVYRFRLIHPGSVYPFQVSVDGHRFEVVATDGMELKDPVVADSVILTPGERYDFALHANHSVDNYWIRATTLQVENPVTTKAILRYEGAQDHADPSTDRRSCTCHKPCVVVNCPFQHFPSRRKYKCVNVGDLRHAEKMPDEIGRGAQNVKEYFLNFAFPGTTFTPGSVNGVQLRMPTVSALTQPLEVTTRCPGDGYRCAEDQLCDCTAALDLAAGDVVQLVLTNMGIGKGWDHPIHMHGHSFWVLKVGYPQYDKRTGDISGDNMDVDCRGNANRNLSYCNHATWSDPSWARSGNAVPGLELDYPIRKDNVNVPTGGYVVIRIKANNPGLWPMHCHVSLHADDGMFLLLNESYPQQPDPPVGFPQCRSFIDDRGVLRSR